MMREFGRMKRESSSYLRFRYFMLSKFNNSKIPSSNGSLNFIKSNSQDSTRILFSFIRTVYHVE
uniref:Uncharacterized protein n=1 Tax=Lepeophtheirus salmonis TaxID=72036 RepID=A0A0K2UZC9_LEPSM